MNVLNINTVPDLGLLAQLFSAEKAKAVQNANKVNGAISFANSVEIVKSMVSYTKFSTESATSKISAAFHEDVTSDILVKSLILNILLKCFSGVQFRWYKCQEAKRCWLVV